MGMSKTPKESLYGTVAANIREARKAIKMTQHELADTAGLSRSTIAQIENARYSSLSLASLEALSAALGVPEVELLTSGEKQPFPAGELFRASPWFEALNPSTSEMATVGRACEAIWPNQTPPPGTLAALLQAIRTYS
jgi:transcriptional regulator with XRE-family HTH domain